MANFIIFVIAMNAFVSVSAVIAEFNVAEILNKYLWQRITLFTFYDNNARPMAFLTCHILLTCA